jgi:hypothetical protein
VIELTARVAQSFYAVGDEITVCWDIDPNDVPFTVTVSHQKPTVRTIASLADQFDSDCIGYKAEQQDVGSVVIVVQARAPSGTTATVSLNTTVRGPTTQ